MSPRHTNPARSLPPDAYSMHDDSSAVPGQVFFFFFANTAPIIRPCSSCYTAPNINSLIGTNFPISLGFATSPIDTHFVEGRSYFDLINYELGPIAVQTVSEHTDKINPGAVTSFLGYQDVESLTGIVGAHAATDYPVVKEFDNWPINTYFETNNFSSNVANLDHDNSVSRVARNSSSNGAEVSFSASILNDFDTTIENVQPFRSASRFYDHMTFNGFEAPSSAPVPNGGISTTENSHPFAFAPSANVHITDAAVPPSAANSDHPLSAPTTANGKYICLHPGCTRGFKRPGDLDRHIKDHLPGPRAFDCPAPGCVRKGMNGFTRKDKMKEHWKCRHR